MKAEAVDCNNCGAPLEVLESTNFATCMHCGSRLRILREASATFSERIAELRDRAEQAEERADELADRVEVMKLEQELDRLDREWEQQRELYFITGRGGERHSPDNPLLIVGAVLIVITGVVVALIGADFFISMLGGVLALVGIGYGTYVRYKAGQLARVDAGFQSERDELERKLARLR